MDHKYYFFSFIENIERSHMHAPYARKVSKHRSAHNWEYIPLHFEDFAKTLEKVIVHANSNGGKFPEKFIEFGCGIAVKTAWARNRGIRNAIGFEYNNALIKRALTIFPNLSESIKKKDVLKLSREDIGKEPVIAYFYQPFKDHKLARKFETLLESLLPVGSYLIAHLKADYKSVEDRKKWIYVEDIYGETIQCTWKKIA